MNLLVNPFGSYTSRLFDPIVVSSRRPKLSLYRERMPSVVVLGSSRSFTMEPAYIEARTSRPAFNAAVHGATTRDYLDLVRCFAAGPSFPSVVIVGLGVEQVLRLGRPVEADEPLAACAGQETASAPAFVNAHRRLLTLEETWASMRVLAMEVVGRPAPSHTFLADGMIRSSAYQPLEEALAISLAGGWRPSTFELDSLHPGALAQVRQLLELCQARGAKVIVYLPPYHPRAVDRYRSESRFESLRAQLLAQLAAWAKRYPLRFHDFTELSRFAGQPDMFYDASHPREDACRLMLDIMLADLA